MRFSQIILLWPILRSLAGSKTILLPASRAGQVSEYWIVISAGATTEITSWKFDISDAPCGPSCSSSDGIYGDGDKRWAIPMKGQDLDLPHIESSGLVKYPTLTPHLLEISTYIADYGTIDPNLSIHSIQLPRLCLWDTTDDPSFPFVVPRVEITTMVRVLRITHDYSTPIAIELQWESPRAREPALMTVETPEGPRPAVDADLWFHDDTFPWQRKSIAAGMLEGDQRQTGDDREGRKEEAGSYSDSNV